MALEGLTESVVGELERVNLQVEEKLWREVCGVSGVAELLEESGCQVLLIGTDSDLTLSRIILKSCPGVGITVVQRDEEVIEEAKGNIPEEMEESDIIPGEFPDVSLPELTYQIIIAKHLLHFFSEEKMREIVTGAIDHLGPGGLFFASAPWLGPFGDVKVRRALRKLNLHIDEQSLGLLKGTLFIITNQA